MQIIDPVHRCLEYIIHSDVRNCSAGDYLPIGSDLKCYSAVHYHKRSRLEKISNEANFLSIRCIWEGWIWRFLYVGKAFHHIVTCRSGIYHNLWHAVCFIIHHWFSQVLCNTWDRPNYNVSYVIVTFVNSKKPTAHIHIKTDPSFFLWVLVLGISLKAHLSNSFTWNEEGKCEWILQK